MKLLENNKVQLLTNLVSLTEVTGKDHPFFWNTNENPSLGRRIINFCEKLFLFGNRRKNKVIQNLLNNLKKIEKTPVFIANDQNDINQDIDFKNVISAVESAIDQFSNTKGLEQQLLTLRRYLIALKYRLGAQNGGLDTVPFDENLYHDIIEKAHIWKLAHHILDEQVLNRGDINKLTIACSYKEFAELLLEDDELTDTFFLWIIRDRINPIPFIEFPEMQQKLVECGLNGRISRYGGNGLKVMVEAIDQFKGQKVLTLLMENRDINILDESAIVTFRGNYQVTVGEIFDTIKNKNSEIGNFEYLQEGIINWNMFKWAWWNADEQTYVYTDFTKFGWWRELPLYEVISKKEARKRYGKHLDGFTWNIAAVSTRGTLTMDFEDSHAFIELAIPIGKGMYRIYPFGKYGIVSTATFLEKLSAVGKTVPATISYPDENVFFTFRQHTRISFKINSKQGLVFLENVKRDLFKGFDGNFVYQIETENCARWTQNQIENIVGRENVPNLFITPLLNAEPQGFVQYIFGLIKKFPKALHVKLLMLVHIPLGALKGLWVEENGEKVWKAITHHEFWETGIVYLPAFLHHQKDKGQLAQVIDQIAYVMDKMRSFSGVIYLPLVNRLIRFVKDVPCQVLFHGYPPMSQGISLRLNSFMGYLRNHFQFSRA